MNERSRKRVLSNTLAAYAKRYYLTDQGAKKTLNMFRDVTITDPVERHLVTYLRWYAAGNQDGGACARVALEIAS